MIRTRPWGRFCLAAAIAASAAGCGDSAAPPPTGPGANPFTITISTGGIVSPKSLTVPPGSRVMFVNSHTRRHDMTSDPHPDHLDCPELNQVGVLNPSQSRESGNLVTVRTCGFHDHDDPDNVNLRGSIVIR
jgi:plastocyanin